MTVTHNATSQELWEPNVHAPQSGLVKAHADSLNDFPKKPRGLPRSYESRQDRICLAPANDCDHADAHVEHSVHLGIIDRADALECSKKGRHLPRAGSNLCSEAIRE